MKKYSPPAQRYYRTKGMRHYEITNHLGNVMATISDRKLGQSPDGDTLINYYHADLLSAQDYYPGGMLMPGRSYSSENYRFGFNGKENDNEVKGAGNQQDYGFRIYDPRAVRFLSVDPLTKNYSELTPYQFAANCPISGIDLEGCEYYFAADGSFIGIANPRVKTVRIIATDLADKAKRNVDEIHKNVTAGEIEFQTIKKITEIKDIAGKSTFREADMDIDDLLDIAHIIYGEEKGRNADVYAHIILNREIEMSLTILKRQGEIIKFVDGKPLRRNSSNTPILKGNEEFGFEDYVIAGIHKPNSIAACKAYLSTIRNGTPQIDGGVENKGYKHFFNYKSNIISLIKNIPVTQSIFKSIFDARLGKTSDPYPNYDGWRGVDGTIDPRNENKEVKSDPNKSN